MSTRVHHERVRGDGVVLLHGFPEDWRSWKHQLPALAGAGFTAVAPDLRGYNESDRPPERSAYHLRHLVADAAAIVRATGHDKAHIVGHDWGGILAWTLAGAHPELVDTLVILNAPHLAIYMEKATRPSLQMLRAWYLLFFRVPRLPEWALSTRDFAAVRDLFRHRPKQPAFSEEDVDGYVRALARPGALTAALNWYRGALPFGVAPRVTVPALYVWGDRDQALGPRAARTTGRWVTAPYRFEVIAGGGHWIPEQHPDRLSAWMLERLDRGGW
jgi:pimeloyl-ACP methyl ester carboxylesterase